MSDRPSFQFYPGDWRLNANLRRCSHAARGAWMDVLCVLHDSDTYGLVRWPLDELANATGVPIKLLRELIDKGVLKGIDKGTCEAFTYTPKHARKEGEPVQLVPAQPGPLWYSSRMVKDEYVRTVRGDSSRFGEADAGAPKGEPKGGPKAAPKAAKGDGSLSSSSSSASPKKEEPPPSGSPPAVAGPRPARKAPRDFVVDEDMRQWARERAQGIDLTLETEKFLDHTFATAKTDWLGAWRNWMRRAAEDRKPGTRAVDAFEGAT